VLGRALDGAALEGADGRFELGDGRATLRQLARILDQLRRFERHRRAGGERCRRADRRRCGGALRDRRLGRTRRRRRRWCREAVDRFLADGLVDAVVDVPFQQRGEVLTRDRRAGHCRRFRKAPRIGAQRAASAWLAMWPLLLGSST
jgi:hypothetical protein